MAGGKKFSNAIAQDKRAFPHRDPAAEIQNDDVIQTPRIDEHAHFGRAPSIPGSLFSMRSRHPPPSLGNRSTSSINERMIKMPRPLGFSRLALSVGSATLSRVKPHPSSSTMISMASPLDEIRRVACLAGSALLPC